MNKETAIAIAAPYFKSYPSVVEFHVTQDKQVFEQKPDAIGHAKTLRKTLTEETVVISVARGESATPVVDLKKLTKEEAVEKAKKQVEAAEADVAAKTQALEDADSKKKGAATNALKKAQEKLEAAKLALDTIMAAE